MTRSKLILAAGIYTVIQSGAQVMISALAVAQYFCLIDFLQNLPILLYIRVLYYHNPSSCGNSIPIGHAIDGISDQAFVLLRSEPLTSFRTFIINCTSLGVGFLWLLASALLLSGGTKVDKTEPTKWPWVLTTIAICAVDVVASVIFANDSFYTRTLSDIMNYIGGTLSGTGNRQIDTAIVSWIMVIIYSRFVVFFLLNVLFVVMVATAKPVSVNHVEAQILPPITQTTTAIQTTSTVSTEVQTSPLPNHVETSPLPNHVETSPLPNHVETTTDAAIDTPPIPSDSPRETDRESSIRTFRLPRADFSYAFRRMKTFLFRKSDTSPKESFITYSVNILPERSPQRRREDDKKRTVNFPENIPDNFQTFRQHLEDKIADQQRRLNQSVIDTSCRQQSQSLPQLNEETEDTVSVNRQRRGTLPDLQSQLPWAYIPASTHRMRDQLPPDEDLPPVPLPDYNVLRRTSVHRTASSLSSLTHKKEYTPQTQRTKTSLTQSDVLY